MNRTSNNLYIGKIGEDYAVQHLVGLGFSIVERNWRFRRLEVDIIASKDRILHFIEVKTRTSTQYGLPEMAVSSQKMSFLKEAAAAFQNDFPEWKKIQFDVVAILLQIGNVKEIHVNWDVYF